MSTTWQQAFDRLEATGANFSDLRTGRAFALDALKLIPRPLPPVVADAEQIAEALRDGSASDKEVANFRERVWKYESTITTLGIPPHKNPTVAALRVAIGATDTSVEPEPWFWVSNGAMLAEGAGVPGETIASLLQRHYGASTEQAAPE